MGGGDNWFATHNLTCTTDICTRKICCSTCQCGAQSDLPPEVEILADGLPLTPQHHKHSLQSAQIGLLDPRPLFHQSFRQLIPQRQTAILPLGTSWLCIGGCWKKYTRVLGIQYWCVRGGSIVPALLFVWDLQLLYLGWRSYGRRPATSTMGRWKCLLPGNALFGDGREICQ